MTAQRSDVETPNLRRILGVDPAASGPTGYGVIETDGRNFRVLRYGALRIPPQRQKSSSGACLHDVHVLLCQLIEEFHPHAMAVESVFTALNMRTALRLAEVRGVVLLAAEQHGVEVRSYSPREVKACVAGYGHADKKTDATDGARPSENGRNARALRRRRRPRRGALPPSGRAIRPPLRTFG